jgi:hypothetical protein
MLYGPGCETGCDADVNDGPQDTPGAGGEDSQDPAPEDSKSDDTADDGSDDKSDGGFGGEDEVVFDPGAEVKKWDKKDPAKAKKHWHKTAEKTCGVRGGELLLEECLRLLGAVLQRPLRLMPPPGRCPAWAGGRAPCH